MEQKERRRRQAIAVSLALIVSMPAFAQEAVNDTVVGQIKGEAFSRSAVMDTLSWIADVYGPRLTGSPTLHQAGEWARDQLTRWGLANAALEPNGSTSRGWSIDRFSIEMTEPQYMRITGYPRAWSPAARLTADRHAGRRRGEVEGRFREVSRQAAGRHRHERPSRSGGHRLSAGRQAADRRGAQEAGRAGRPGVAELSEHAEVVLGRGRRVSEGARETARSLRVLCQGGRRRAGDAELPSARRSARTASTITCGIPRIQASSSRANTTAASSACSI